MKTKTTKATKAATKIASSAPAADDSLANVQYLIWSLDKKAWWKADGNGFSKSKVEAEHFTLINATDICERRNGESDTPEVAIVPIPH